MLLRKILNKRLKNQYLLRKIINKKKVNHTKLFLIFQNQYIFLYFYPVKTTRKLLIFSNFFKLVYKYLYTRYNILFLTIFSDFPFLWVKKRSLFPFSIFSLTLFYRCLKLPHLLKYLIIGCQAYSQLFIA